MRLIVGSSFALFSFILVVSARPNAPSTSEGVEENGAKIESSISTTNRYRQAIHLTNTSRGLRNSKIHDFRNLYSNQTEWLPISSSSQTKRKIKIKNKITINMVNFTTALNNSIEQTTARTNTDRLNVKTNNRGIGSNHIKPNALGINIVSGKEGSNSLNDNPFEKNHIPFTDSNLVESFIHNTIPDLKSTPGSLIIHPKFPNTNFSNKYFENNNEHNNNNNHQWNSHKNQYIIVEDVDPAYLPKPPPPPQPPWYDTWHDSSKPLSDNWNDNYNTPPPDPWPEYHTPQTSPWQEYHNPKPESWQETHNVSPDPWPETHNPSPELWQENNSPQPEPPSLVFHSEITYFPPDPEPEPKPPSPEPSPEYAYIPITRPQTTPEPVPEHNYHYPPYRPTPSSETNSQSQRPDQSKPVNPVYDDPVFVEPNTPIFITPVSITNIQNNPLNPIVATNGQPPPSIVVLEDLSVANDAPPAGAGLDATIGTTMTGSVTLGDPGVGSAAGAGGGGGAGAAAAAAAAGGAGAAGGAAAAAAAASSAAVATGITGGVVGSAAAGSAAMCNNIQLNSFNRQGIQCPPVNINVLSSGNVPPDGALDDDPGPPAQAPSNTPMDDPDDGGVILGSFSLFEYLSSLFGAINVLNPVGFAFWALMFAPLSILVTSGLGAMAFFFPWLFPRLWLGGRSLRTRRSFQNETDLLFFLNNRMNYDLDYLEKLLLTMESNRQIANLHLKNVKQRRKRR
uniref:Uncharacterized protein n=1 Tax=Cacopsylla melanoneura TaxID=428564 RepID=A0A8D9EUN1_9HEMI